MNIRLVVLFLGLGAGMLVGGAGISAAYTGSSIDSPEVEGVTSGSVGMSEAEGGESVLDSIGGFDVVVADQVAVVQNGEGDPAVVFSNEPIPPGYVEVEGRNVPGASMEYKVVVADDFEVSTDGERVTVGELKQNPEEYAYQLVEVETDVTTGAVASKPASGVGESVAFASLDTQPFDTDSVVGSSPGELARWGSVNLTADEVGGSQEITDRLPDSDLQAFSLQEQYWGGGSGVVTVGVVPGQLELPIEFDWAGNGHDLVYVDTEYDAERVSSIGGADSGTGPVTIEADAVGTSTSTQEFLTSVVSCGGNTIWIPTTPICVPVVTDVAVHSGTLVETSGNGDVSTLPYIASSNRVQSGIVQAEEGRYEMTGHVVSAADLGVGEMVDGEVLFVTDRERTGSLSIPGQAADQVGAVVDELEGGMQAQINSTWAETEDGSEDGGGDDESDDGTEPIDEGNTGENGEGGSASEDTEPEDPYIDETSLEDRTVEAGETFGATADIWNPGDSPTEKELTLYIDGDPVSTKTANVPIVRGPTTITETIDEPGTYDIRINDERVGELTVVENTSAAESSDVSGSYGEQESEPPSGISNPTIGFILGPILITVTASAISRYGISRGGDRGEDSGKYELGYVEMVVGSLMLPIPILAILWESLPAEEVLEPNAVIFGILSTILVLVALLLFVLHQYKERISNKATNTELDEHLLVLVVGFLGMAASGTMVPQILGFWAFIGVVGILSVGAFTLLRTAYEEV